MYPSAAADAVAAAIKQAGDRGQGEGADLLADARETLLDAPADELASLVASHPAAVVRRALQRVKATPEREIRKSRLALFRYLLAKLSEELDVRDL